MTYSDFMAGHPDEAKRREMWQLFVLVERHAKTFAGSQNHWKMLKSVNLGTTGAKWSSSGRIQLGAGSAPGTMFHEVFHNTYDGSALHAGNDNAWSEAFCDAFRYMMEKSILPESETGWFKKVDGFCGMTYAQVMAKSGDKSFDRKYLYPASLIIRKVDKDPRRFRDLWMALQQLRNERKADILDDVFQYDMRGGRPKSE